VARTPDSSIATTSLDCDQFHSLQWNDIIQMIAWNHINTVLDQPSQT
jgi:hypothetical protein